MTNEQADDLAEPPYKLAELRELLADVDLVSQVVLTAVERGWSRCEEPTSAISSCARLQLYLGHQIEAAEDRLPRCGSTAYFHDDPEQPMACDGHEGHSGFHVDKEYNCEWTDATP